VGRKSGEGTRWIKAKHTKRKKGKRKRKEIECQKNIKIPHGVSRNTRKTKQIERKEENQDKEKPLQQQHIASCVKVVCFV
jgi:2-methylcitrate dehydratase PrpD